MSLYKTTCFIHHICFLYNAYFYINDAAVYQTRVLHANWCYIESQATGVEKNLRSCGHIASSIHAGQLNKHNIHTSMHTCNFTYAHTHADMHTCMLADKAFTCNHTCNHTRMWTIYMHADTHRADGRLSRRIVRQRQPWIAPPQKVYVVVLEP